MELIKKLAESFGPSGNEEDTAKIIFDEIKEYADEVKRDRLGNIIAIKKGKGKGRIMYTAHMDQIGILVLDIDKNGFLRFTNVGEYKPSSILNQLVCFKNGIIGRVCAENIDDKKELKIKDLFIDVGASNHDEIKDLIEIGTFGVIKSQFFVNNNRIITGALDDRIGCYALIETLKRLKNNEYDVYFVFTVQEETYISGAAVAGFSIEPDFAVAVDVTLTGDSMEGIKTSVKLGEGTAITIMDDGIITHPEVKNFLIDTARKYNIKYQFDIAKGTTDASQIHVVKCGIKTGTLCIPVRYMHTPYEVADMKDIECTIDLLVKAAEEYN